MKISSVTFRFYSIVLVIVALGCSDSETAVLDSGPAADGATSDGKAADGSSDGAAADRSTVDAAKGPIAAVYTNNPVEDKRKTSQVTLKHITDQSGLLSGKYARVYNCTQNENAKPVSINLGGMKLSGIICTPGQTAKPDSHGAYLHHTPPKDDTAGNDTFAEVMMYHHVTTIHDHLSKSFGLSHIDKKPLFALVNLQGKTDFMAGWVGLPNAAYFPKDAVAMLKQYGLELTEANDGGIVFGYNNELTKLFAPSLPVANFAYDASVIYHEYTHYTIGERLWSPAPDKYGADPTPRGLNEALADYFPSSFLNFQKMGTYALGKKARDLTRVLRCPDHLAGEEHRDGEIASGALWAARTVLGASVADRAFWNAVLTFGNRTTFAEASLAFLSEIKNLAPSKEAAVRTIFTDRGMLSCVRLKDHVDLPKSGATAPYMAGKGMLGKVFSGGSPAYLQYKLAILPTTKEITFEYAGSTSGLMGVGGTAADISLALKKGGTPIMYDYSSGVAKSTAMTVLSGTSDGKGGFKLVISGDCVFKGDLVYQFINNSGSTASISRLTISQSATKTNTSDNFSYCPK